MHDYHTHNHFCRHATGSIEDYARRAADLGIDEICCTPHIPLPGLWPGFFNDKLRMDEDEFPLFVEELELARARVPGVTVLCGVEADYIGGWEEYLERFLSAYPFDFVLMSIHHVQKWPLGQWTFDYASDPRPLECVYDDYFDAMDAGIQTGLFDCVAHMDLIKRTGHPVLPTHRDRVERVIDLCLQRGMCAEINTSGTRKEIGETYPAGEIVRLMQARGLPLVSGSDAHAPSQVGYGFEGLASVGSQGLVSYRKRRSVEVRKQGQPAHT
jgi:histidinol-phosphatase (PHP family)